MSTDNFESRLSDLLAHVVRVGFVTGRDEAAHRVRVEVTDSSSGALTTASLQVLIPRAKEDKQYDLPDVGDQVLCLFLPFGKECGFVLGSMYAAESPPVASGDKWHRSFKDGTRLEYDRASHELTAVVKGRADIKTDKDIKAEAGTTLDAKAGTSASVTAPTIYLNGNVVAGGSESGSQATVTENAQRTINGSLTINGPVNINGDLTTSGNSKTGGDSYAASRSGASI
ncbi:phage baseplate assembly protein V [Desulfovibrio sp. OttesenSCG-928-G11]|nr:phage baseplate assembly protein V [Desulfovibrio sp. OttesenSCG-928-G11]